MITQTRTHAQTRVHQRASIRARSDGKKGTGIHVFPRRPRMHTHIHETPSSRIHAYTHSCAHMGINACTQSRMHTYTCMHAHSHTCMHAFIYTFTLVNIPACTHAHTLLLRLTHARRHARAQRARASTRIHTCTVGKDDMNMHTCVSA
jgi:hypothetical protein